MIKQNRKVHKIQNLSNYLDNRQTVDIIVQIVNYINLDVAVNNLLIKCPDM